MPTALRVIRYLRNPLFCVVSIVFAVPVTRIIALVDSVEVELMNKVAAAAILLIILAFFCLRYGPARNSGLVKNFDIPQLYHISLPLVATMLVLYTIFGHILALGTSVLIFVLFYIVWVLLIPACLHTAQQLGVSPLLPFGIANAAVNLVFAFSTWLGKVLYASGSFFGAATLGVCMLLVLYVLMMTATVQGRKAHKQSGAPADGLTQNPSIGLSCQRLSEKHQLTPRESEVLLLLADGRDTPYIATQLFLSKNTVRTHVKNLYAKVDVHNKQQLLDLLHIPDNQK
jgi:DNA-binding CsgD family transcriptional regulator